ncbi:MAG TPA: membrane dipeptidase, partial [Thermoanaerobaculia bacterium]|nr:membrane dipeptidase [Thermoanaerobaculia bacterium]
VAAFYELGQRVSQLTYNGRNRLGDGCYVRPDRGLTRFGQAVVGEMNRVGMAVDVSHCGERTSLDAIAASRMPVLVTHGNCKALVPGQRRCKSDAVIRRLARSGGVMGITMVRAFVSSAPNPTLGDLLDHFDHVANLVGPEHVGLGSDTDVTAVDPRTGRVRPFYKLRGLDPADRVFQIADGLLGRGWTRKDVKLVLGGNFARALAQIWHPVSRNGLLREQRRRDPFCPAPRPLGAELRFGH